MDSNLQRELMKDLGPTKMDSNTRKSLMRDLGHNETVYSSEEVDDMTLARFRAGQREGMYKCHDAFSDTLVRLRQSLEDVWAIEYSGVITPEKKARVAELTFAINTLTTLDDMFQGEYDTKLDKLSSQVGIDDV